MMLLSLPLRVGQKPHINIKMELTMKFHHFACAFIASTAAFFAPICAQDTITAYDSPKIVIELPEMNNMTPEGKVYIVPICIYDTGYHHQRQDGTWFCVDKRDIDRPRPFVEEGVE